MNKTLKEELAFTAMMVFGMATIMLSYNSILTFGLTAEAFRFMAIQFIPTFIVAFAIEQFVVSHNVHKLHKILVKPNAPGFKHIIVLALLFVTFMALLMSLYGTLLSTGTGPDFWTHYFTNFVRNWPVALFTQLVIMGPLVRIVHMKIFARTKLVE